MVDVDKLSDAELRTKLLEFGFPVMPITGTTRKVMAKKLKLLLENKNKISNDSSSSRRSLGRYSSEEESDTDAKSSRKDKNRRATMAAPLMQPPQSTTRGRRSTSRLNETLDEVPSPPKRELKSSITTTTRSQKIVKTAQDEFDTGSDSESDLIGNNYNSATNNIDYSRNSPVKSPILSYNSTLSSDRYSPQRSVDTSYSRTSYSTAGSPSRISTYTSPLGGGSSASEYASERLNQIRSRLSLNNSVYDRPTSYTSAVTEEVTEETPFLSNFTKKLSALSHQKKDDDFKNDVIKEYDLNGTTNVKNQLKSYRAARGRDTTYDYRMNQNSILRNNFVSFAVLAGAAMFFIILAATYLSMKTDTAIEPAVPPCVRSDPKSKRGVNCLEQEDLEDAINLLKVVKPELNKKAVANKCYDSTMKSHMTEGEIVTYCTTNFAINDEHKIRRDLRNLEVLTFYNPDWNVRIVQTPTNDGLVYEKDVASNMEEVIFNLGRKNTSLVIFSPELPWKCRITNTLYFIVKSFLFIGLMFGIAYVSNLIYKYYRHYQQKQKDEVGFMVERIIDVLQTNANEDGEKFVVINHVRDMILPVADRKREEDSTEITDDEDDVEPAALATKNPDELKREFLKKLAKEDPAQIEKLTRGQNQNDLWMKLRRKRLTASNFGKIYKRKLTTNPMNLVNSLLNSNFQGNEATKYGNDHEDEAIRDFEEYMNFTVRKCGLFIDKVWHFLAASPDGVIAEEDAIIEVKCPASAKNFTPEEAVRKGLLKYLTMANGSLKLNENHDYYYQIQGQLNISGYDRCYFIVWTPKKFWFQVIEKNEKLWKNMTAKLEEFYMDYYLPKLVSRN